MRAADRDTVITPGKVFRALGKAADCGSCMTVVLGTMRRNDNLEVPMALRGLRGSMRSGPRKGERDAGRRDA
jgi:bacterioferritin-associated ferredoxin